MNNMATTRTEQHVKHDKTKNGKDYRNRGIDIQHTQRPGDIFVHYNDIFLHYLT